MAELTLLLLLLLLIVLLVCLHVAAASSHSEQVVDVWFFRHHLQHANHHQTSRHQYFTLRSLHLLAVCSCSFLEVGADHKRRSSVNFGGYIFARKYMYEKLTKCPNLHDICQKNTFFPIFWGCFLPPRSPRLRLWRRQSTTTKLVSISQNVMKQEEISDCTGSEWLIKTKKSALCVVLAEMLQANDFDSQRLTKLCTVPWHFIARHLIAATINRSDN